MRFELLKPEYEFLKVIPSTSIRNNRSYSIAAAIQSLYKPVSNRFSFDDYAQLSSLVYPTTIRFELPAKVSYMIYISKKSPDLAEFYFIVEKKQKKILKEALSRVWGAVTMYDVNSLPEFTDKAAIRQLTYTKEDALSLQVDLRDNDLLNSNLNIIDIISDVDKIGIFYNFIPTNQFTWRATYQNTVQKYEEGKPIDRNKINAFYFFKSAFNVLYDIVNTFDTRNKTNAIAIKELSDITKSKRAETILNTQIAILAESSSNINNITLTRSLSNSFRVIDNDNTLKVKKLKNFKYTDLNIKADINKCSTMECANFIALPGRELLEKHHINHINTLEVEVPKELSTGVMGLGKSTIRGNSQSAFLSTDFAYKFLTVCIIGPTRSGKSTLISNLCVDSSSAGEVNIIFDWCGNSDLSNDVVRALDKKRLKSLVIDVSDVDKIQGMGYNELYCKTGNTFEQYRSAKTQSMQLMTLINSIQGGEDDLKARMERYLEAAAVVVFLQNGPVKDVFQILQNHKLRANYINKIPKNQRENTAEYVEALAELDERDKKTDEVIGTKLTPVQGILNRANKLKQNTYLELMLKKDCSKNIDLNKEIQTAQTICIKMPENLFQTEAEKDICATYWLTKIWGTLQQRKWFMKDNEKDVLKVNLYFDELYQTPNCQEFLRSKLSQIAKFNAKSIISCHYLDQIKKIRDELKAANTSYILISGCDKFNYNELKEELDPYELKDLLNLKRYHALNLIKYSEGYARFITELPKPI